MKQEPTKLQSLIEVLKQDADCLTNGGLVVDGLMEIIGKDLKDAADILSCLDTAEYISNILEKKFEGERHMKYESTKNDEKETDRIYSLVFRDERNGEELALGSLHSPLDKDAQIGVDIVSISPVDDDGQSFVTLRFFQQDEEDPEEEPEEDEDIGDLGEMPYRERVKAYRKIIKHYGDGKQCLKAVEEMSELTKEITKFLLAARTKEGKLLHALLDKDTLVEEIADATIMLEQLRIIANCNEEVKAIMADKINRTLDRIQGEKG